MLETETGNTEDEYIGICSAQGLRKFWGKMTGRGGEEETFV